MTRNEYSVETVYDEVQLFDGLELGGSQAVTGSIASVLEHGEVLNDTGSQYTSIQTAIDDAESWVFIGPGTYHEGINTIGSELTILGSGYNTVIDGNSLDTVFDAGSDMNISHLRFLNGGNQLFVGNECHVRSCYFENSNQDAINTTGRRNVINHNTIRFAEDNGINIQTSSESNIVSANYVDTTVVLQGIICNESDDNIIANNFVNNADQNGIYIRFNANDNIVSGNRVQNVGQAGIDVTNNANDNIVSNNRISDSGGSDITNGGTGTVLDGNLTGTAN
jgi:parallel beta-helix repeat protein